MNGWPLILFLSLTLTALILTVFPVGGLNVVFFILAGAVAYVRFALFVAAWVAHAHKGVRP